MKISDITDGEVCGVFDKDERLDSLVLRETDVITKVAYISDIVEGVDKNRNRYLTFTLRDKRGLSMAAFLFNANNEVMLSEYLELNNKIVIVQGSVECHKNSLNIHVTSITPVSDAGYTRTDFMQKNVHIDDMSVRLKNILEQCSTVEYLSDVVKHIKKLNVTESLPKSDLVGYNCSRCGDLLESVVLTCENLLSRNMVTKDGIDISKVGCIFLILREGLSSFIKTQVVKNDSLLSNEHTTTLTLINNLMKSYNLFNTKGIDEKLKLEFLHYNEVCMNVVKPKTLLANYLTETFEQYKNNIVMQNIFEDSKTGNRYLIDGYEINRIM